MANHKSAKKRIRQNAVRRLRNRYYHKTMRNALQTIRESEDKKEVTELQPKLVAMIDKLAKKNIIHKNKAANLKSSIAKKVASL
jgi:small subunit ribosomal protein S20